ncbi:MAG: hypothetical protein IJ218_00065 [Alphaproteobacteria bacterium]|nr:hypothetical protein [Alphaproteobacteria bacterium]
MTENDATALIKQIKQLKIFDETNHSIRYNTSKAIRDVKITINFNDSYAKTSTKRWLLERILKSFEKQFYKFTMLYKLAVDKYQANINIFQTPLAYSAIMFWYIRRNIKPYISDIDFRCQIQPPQRGFHPEEYMMTQIKNSPYRNPKNKISGE